MFTQSLNATQNVSAGWNSRSLVFFFVAVAAFIAAVLLPRHTHLDDAAITYRYVERLTSGEGLTYNDHETVYGASNPLYILLLSGLHLTGVSIEAAATLLGSFLFIVSVVLVAYITTMISTLTAGFFASFILLITPFYREQALSGMESILGVALGLMVVLFLLQIREVPAGIFLGLAVWNKLDAGLLAVAVAAAWIAVHKRFPWRIALVSLAVVSPWLVFSQFYFGTIIPNSASTKLFVHGLAQHHNHYWVLDFIKNANILCILAPLSILSLFFLIRASEGVKVTLLTLLLWFIFHSLAITMINFGGEYSWYLLALIPPISILGCMSIAGVGNFLFRNRRYGALLVAALFILICAQNIIYTGELIKARNPVSPYEAFDTDRRLAGIFIDQYAGKNEIVQSYFGWVAYENNNPFNDLTLLNSKQILEPAKYYVAHGVGYESGNNPPKRMSGFDIPLATFSLANDLFPGWSWFTLFGREDSEIAVSGKRFLQYRLFELPKPRPVSAEFGIDSIEVSGIDLVAPPPSGAVVQIRNYRQPVSIVFLPAVDQEAQNKTPDEVQFAVQVNDSTLFHRKIGLHETVDPVIQMIPNSERRDSLDITFMTIPTAGRQHVRSVWKNLKIVLGDAFIHLDRIKDKQLRDAWARWNPTKKQ